MIKEKLKIGTIDNIIFNYYELNINDMDYNKKIIIYIKKDQIKSLMDCFQKNTLINLTFDNKMYDIFITEFQLHQTENEYIIVFIEIFIPSIECQKDKTKNYQYYKNSEIKLKNLRGEL
jgi:hypothetical protein